MNEDLQSQSSRYQQLKQRKDALEKSLNEKYEQLHQICQKVSNDRWVMHDRIPGISLHSCLFLFLGGYTDRQQPRSHTFGRDFIAINAKEARRQQL